MIIYNSDYSLYIHTNKTNGKMYVGITKQRVEDRWKNGHAYKGNPIFYNAILKYGWDNFEHEVFASGLTEQEAKRMEEIQIKHLNLQNKEYGYNITGGGDVPITHNDYVRNKISKAVSGINHPCYGKHLSQDTRKKISDSEKGVKKPSIAVLKSKPIVCIETNTIYPSAKIAGEALCVERTGIVQVLHGKRNMAGGYHWRYLNNDCN